MLQTSDLERSDRNCHLKSDNYILIPKTTMPEEYEGVLLASTQPRGCFVYKPLCSRNIQLAKNKAVQLKNIF